MAPSDPPPFAKVDEALAQALADLESQREWIEKRGDPQAHIKGRSLQATKEVESARALLASALKGAERVWYCASGRWISDKPLMVLHGEESRNACACELLGGENPGCGWRTLLPRETEEGNRDA